jgi:hypothetical protein
MLTERQLTVLAESALEVDDPRARATIVALLREIRRFPPGAICFKDLPDGAQFIACEDSDLPVPNRPFTKVKPGSEPWHYNATASNGLLRYMALWELVIPVEATT